ncbi:hypothetical protein Xhom_02450 [Xenorhabdus hominickii]|uniref:Uncharacterized protein n=1 Tax=Xenorhabdus hominickii TaxID=351679 RepID=A0A2G0Q916_XENHO|nr:hypothetical protein Xhom_02450 [Xenorhabdus hominickii]
MTLYRTSVKSFSNGGVVLKPIIIVVQSGTDMDNIPDLPEHKE